MHRSRTFFIILLAILCLSFSGCSHQFKVLNGMPAYPKAVIDGNLSRVIKDDSTGYTILEFSDVHRTRHVLYHFHGKKMLEITKELDAPHFLWYAGEWGTLKEQAYQNILQMMFDVHSGKQQALTIVQVK